MDKLRALALQKSLDATIRGGAMDLNLNLTSDAALLNDTIDDDDLDNLTRNARSRYLSGDFPYPSLHSWQHIVVASLVVSAIMAAIVIGNGLVVVAISIDKSLNGLQNWFVASLAVSDLLVGLFIMPLSLANELMGYWYFGDTICELWLSTDVLLCTASILNLCLISLDRYWSITRAITYIKDRTRNRAILMISVVWLLSMTICFPPLVGWKRPQPMRSGYPLCILSEEPGYVVYSSIGSFYLPLVVMVLVYFKIYKAARKRARRNLSRCGGVTFPEKTFRSRLLRRTTFSTSNSVQDESGTPQIGPSKSIAVSSTLCNSNQRLDKPLIVDKESCSPRENNAKDDFLPLTDQGPDDCVTLPPSDRNPVSETVKDGNPGKELLERSGSISICTSVELHRNPACHSAQSTLSHETRPVFHYDDEISGTESDCLQQHPHCHHSQQLQHHQRPHHLDGGVDRRPLALQLLIGRCSFPNSSSPRGTSSSIDLDKDAVAVEAAFRVRRTISHLPGNFLQYIPAILSRRHLSGFTHQPQQQQHQQQQQRHQANDRRHQASADHDRAKRRVARVKERRAIVVLGIVMASFVGCWLPFFSIYPIMSVAGLQVSDSVFAVIFWLGYCNSALNPIIYTIFNQDFRNAFAHILFRRRASYRHQAY